MSTARISVNVDSEVKKSAQLILNDIGMDLTTAIDLLLRTIVREERIPFELRTAKAYREDTYRRYINAELEKSKLEAADPSTRWLSHGSLVAQLEKQRHARTGI